MCRISLASWARPSCSRCGATGVAVFAADGTPDFSFQTGGWGNTIFPTSASILSDGRVWVAGGFNRFGATPLPGLAQFTSAGALGTAQPIIVSPQGPVTVPVAAVADAGNDQTFALWSDSNGIGASQLLRLNADASIDTNFAPQLPVGYALSSATVSASPGGKLLLAQPSVAPEAVVAGTVGDALLRLTATGARDTSFNVALAAAGRDRTRCQRGDHHGPDWWRPGRPGIARRPLARNCQRRRRNRALGAVERRWLGRYHV